MLARICRKGSIRPARDIVEWIKKLDRAHVQLEHIQHTFKRDNMKPKAVAVFNTKDCDKGRCSRNVAGQINFLPTLLCTALLIDGTVFITL